MADQPTTAKNPRPSASAQVRGFLNLSAPLPDFGAVKQKDTDLTSLSGSQGLLFGGTNTVPVLAMAAAHQSGTAYRCLERRAQFLEGAGFPMPERDPLTGLLLRAEEAGTMGETPVPGHVGKNANDLWAELCSYGSYNNAAAVLVRYRGKAGGYAIGEVHVLDFRAVRKTVNGTYLLNHKFGRKGFAQSRTTEHMPFNPDPKQVRKEMQAGMALAAKAGKPYEQAGQIFYIYTPKAGEEDYPLPPHWAGLEAVLADAAYARYDLEEVERGFAAKGMIAFVGEQDDKVEDEDGNTERDRTDLMLQRYTGAGAKEQGVPRESIMVFDAKSKDLIPVWIPMATTVDLKWLSEKKEAVGQEVCRHIGIPPILAGFAKAGQLGASQEIVNAANITQNSVESLRKLLLRAFWRLVPTLNGVVPGKLDPAGLVAEITAKTPAK
jgi:hypothetical protein